MTRDPDAELIEAIGAFHHDPLGFARFAFPWGEAGTELAEEAGLRTWQAELLGIIGERLREGSRSATRSGPGQQPIRIALASGHGIGSSLSEKTAQAVDVYAFLLAKLGVAYKPVAGAR